MKKTLATVGGISAMVVAIWVAQHDMKLVPQDDIYLSETAFGVHWAPSPDAAYYQLWARYATASADWDTALVYAGQDTAAAIPIRGPGRIEAWAVSVSAEALEAAGPRGDWTLRLMPR